METPASYNVLLADEQAIFRNGFLLVLQEQIRIRKVFHADDGFDLIKKIHHNAIDIVFMDYYIPFMDGEECMKVIRKEFPKVKVIFISMMDSVSDIMKMMQAGAHGFIIKNFSGDELGIAIKTVMSGRRYFDSYVSTMLIEEKIQTTEDPAFKSIRLTSREREILQMITLGKISKEIACLLHTSQETVEKHRRHILKKIEGHGVADMIRYSLKNRIVSIKEFLYGEDCRPRRKNSWLNESVLKDVVNR